MDYLFAKCILLYITLLCYVVSVSAQPKSSPLYDEEKAAAVASATELFEGDMLIRSSQLKVNYGDTVYQKVKQAKPWAIYDDDLGTDHRARRLDLINEYQYLWTYREAQPASSYAQPRLVIPYEIESGTFNSLQIQIIKETLGKMAQQLAYITFVSIDKAPEIIGNSSLNKSNLDYVSIIDGTGCWSYVGRMGGRQEISYDSTGCIYNRPIMHEMLHALGFYHEQSRPDRDEYVTVHWDNILEDKWPNFDKQINVDSLGSSYDLLSIMHYSRTAFARADGLVALTSNADPTLELGSLELTEKDIRQFRMLYRCPSGPRSSAYYCDAACPCPVGEFPCAADDHCVYGSSCDLSTSICYAEPTPEPTRSPTVPGQTWSPTSVPTTRSPTVRPTTREPTQSPTSQSSLQNSTAISVIASSYSQISQSEFVQQLKAFINKALALQSPQFPVFVAAILLILILSLLSAGCCRSSSAVASLDDSLNSDRHPFESYQRVSPSDDNV